MKPATKLAATANKKKLSAKAIDNKQLAISFDEKSVLNRMPVQATELRYRLSQEEHNRFPQGRFH